MIIWYTQSTTTNLIKIRPNYFAAHILDPTTPNKGSSLIDRIHTIINSQAYAFLYPMISHHTTNASAIQSENSTVNHPFSISFIHMGYTTLDLPNDLVSESLIWGSHQIYIQASEVKVSSLMRLYNNQQ